MKEHDPSDLQNKYKLNYQKVDKSNKQLRNLRLPNKKVIPIHTQPITMPRQSRQQYLKRTIDEHNPEIWGCILTQHIKKVQKIRLSKSRKKCKTEQKISILTQKKQKQKSVHLLQQYLSRKRKKTQYDQAINSKYSISGDDKKAKRISLRVIDQQGHTAQREKYIDIQMRQQREKKALEVEKKIRELHSLIKWRTKVLDKIGQQLSNLRTQQIIQS